MVYAGIALIRLSGCESPNSNLRFGRTTLRVVESKSARASRKARKAEGAAPPKPRLLVGGATQRKAPL